jgi:hypothetical protein
MTPADLSTPFPVYCALLLGYTALGVFITGGLAYGWHRFECWLARRRSQ